MRRLRSEPEVSRYPANGDVDLRTYLLTLLMHRYRNPVRFAVARNDFYRIFGGYRAFIFLPRTHHHHMLMMMISEVREEEQTHNLLTHAS